LPLLEHIADRLQQVVELLLGIPPGLRGRSAWPMVCVPYRCRGALICRMHRAVTRTLTADDREMRLLPDG
jgi:hypothetical protein